MLVKVYSPQTLPEKYKQDILTTDMCRRGQSFIPNDYIAHALNWHLNPWMDPIEAPEYVVVALEDDVVVGFIVAFNRERYPAKRQMFRNRKNKCYIDIICRKEGSHYKQVVPEMLKRLFKEILDLSGPTKFKLTATSPEAMRAYQKYGFVLDIVDRSQTIRRDPDATRHAMYMYLKH
jgi:hypothetical protein